MIDIDAWAEAGARERAAGPSLPAAVPEPCQGHALGRARLPGADPVAGDQGLRRGNADRSASATPLAAARHPQQVRRLVRGRRPARARRAWPLSIFQAALNLSESRLGALFVVLRDPQHSIPQLIAPPDQIIAGGRRRRSRKTPTTSRPSTPSGLAPPRRPRHELWPTSTPRCWRRSPASTAPL